MIIILAASWIANTYLSFEVLTAVSMKMILQTTWLGILDDLLISRINAILSNMFAFMSSYKSCVNQALISYWHSLMCEDDYGNGGSESIFLLNIPLQRGNLIPCSCWKNVTEWSCFHISQRKTNLLFVSWFCISEEGKQKKNDTCTNLPDDT